MKDAMKSTVWQNGSCESFYRKGKTGEVITLSLESMVNFIFSRKWFHSRDYQLLKYAPISYPGSAIKDTDQSFLHGLVHGNCVSVDYHLVFPIHSRRFKPFGKVILEMRVACDTAIRMNNVSFRAGYVQKVLNRK